MFLKRKRMPNFTVRHTPKILYKYEQWKQYAELHSQAYTQMYHISKNK
jgi:hypothetical protein